MMWADLKLARMLSFETGHCLVCRQGATSVERDYISGRLLPSSVVCDVLAGLHRDGLGLPVTHLAATRRHSEPKS